MSEQPKPKKPFLKKGSREFLSNAQVRTKVQIIDYGAPEYMEEQFNIPAHRSHTQVPSQNYSNDGQDQIKVSVKPRSNKEIAREPLVPKKIERPPVSNSSGAKPKRQSSISKKKEASLSDYLDGDNDVPEKASFPKAQRERSTSVKKNKQKPVEVSKKGSLLSANLIRQDVDSDEDPTPDFQNNSSFRPLQNPYRKQNQPKLQPKIEPVELQMSQEQVNFVSQSDGSDTEEPQPHYGRPAGFPNKGFQKQNKTVNDQTPPAPSKIKMNYFNHGKNITKPLTEAVEVVSQPKALTINDIPKQLKEQIVRQAIAEKENQLQSELQKLKQKVASVSKTKEKLQQEQRAMGRMRAEFEKQMQERQKELDQKMKSENSKLAREKKYMKDAQMSNKGDWKAKTQVAELRKALDEAKEEKKKVEQKYKVENENLRKKLAEEANKNKLLGQQVKLLEYGKMMVLQDQQQERTKDRKANFQHYAPQWVDAPKTTFLQRMLAPDFSLVQFKITEYFYDVNEYYQFYEKVKNQHSTLDSETADSDRVKRFYKNGKVEHEYFGRFLKEIFPFNYQVINFVNGDIKQNLPEGITIYYSHQKAIQYNVKSESFSREIVYFLSQETVQMEYVDGEGKTLEVYNGEQLKRTCENGAVVYQKRDRLGNITQYKSNS